MIGVNRVLLKDEFFKENLGFDGVRVGIIGFANVGFQSQSNVFSFDFVMFVGGVCFGHGFRRGCFVATWDYDREYVGVA